MPTPLSGQISFGHMREEGNKTSWVSPNYPTPGRKLDIDFAWMQSVDPNGQLQADASGQVMASSFYGWSTWKKPVLSTLTAYQFNADGGVRLYWQVASGDPFRSAYLVVRHTSNVSASEALTNGTKVAILRYGPEWPNIYLKQIIQSPLRFISLYGDSGVPIYSPETWGNHDDQQPDSNLKTIPSAVASPSMETVHFSFVDDTVSGTSGGNGPFYYWVFPLDGRQFHVLDLIRDCGDFTTVSNPTDYMQYEMGSSLQAVVRDMGSGDYKSGSNGIVLFNAPGSFTATNINTQSVTLTPANLYYYFMQGATPKWWVYIQQGTGKPVPDSTSNSTATTGDQQLDQWFPYEGLPITLDALSENTTYRVYIEPYSTDHPNSPTTYPSGTDYVQFTTDQAAPQNVYMSSWPQPTIVTKRLGFTLPQDLEITVRDPDGLRGRAHLIVDDGGNQPINQDINTGQKYTVTVQNSSVSITAYLIDDSGYDYYYGPSKTITV